jgi:diaminopimelate decarboxylase
VAARAPAAGITRPTSAVQPPLFPITARVNGAGRIEIGGCDLLDLVAEFGTPLYVYDEATVRGRAREFRAAIGDAGEILYSAKAFGSPRFLRIVREEGLGVDVVSEGELEFALRAGFAGDQISFLGNNKSPADVAAAIRAGATLVIDGFHDFDLVAGLGLATQRVRCQVRVSPAILPDTHQHIATGQLDSKFGFSIEGGAARRAVERALGDPNLELTGLHSHIGSQIFDLGAHAAALGIVLDLAAELQRDLAWTPAILGAGGGLAIAYTRDDDPPTPAEFVQLLLGTLRAGCGERDLAVPRLSLEPGRSLAGPAGVALYRVGAIKEIPRLRTYVAVDGGMGDNIRPKLYGARYEAFKVDEPDPERTQLVTVAGKYCESTDILVGDAQLPPLSPGDVLCVPASGAYHLAMASSYNGIPRPAAVLVREGAATLIRRRETLDDLLRTEVL